MKNPNFALSRKFSVNSSFSSKHLTNGIFHSTRNFGLRDIPLASSTKNAFSIPNSYQNRLYCAKSSKETPKVKNDLKMNRYSGQRFIRNECNSISSNPVQNKCLKCNRNTQKSEKSFPPLHNESLTIEQ